jgi:peptidoglycan hydrolase-like protein with peptidoglycan-binding domain
VKNRNLVFVCAGAVVLAVAAGFVGSNFASPNQQAAEAKAPALTPITAPVRFKVLQATVAIRANVVDSRQTSFGVPDDLGSDLPVVTQLNERQRSEVQDGNWIIAIAGRPIIAMVGSIPAYRDMSLGESGVDVEELQQNLHQLGYGTGSDAEGVFGRGTEQAVRLFYAHLGFSPALEPSTASAKQSLSAYVPRGEVVFFPTLPEQVVKLNVNLGGTVASGASVGELGSGSIVIDGAAVPGTQTNVRPGQSASIFSDTSNESFSATVTSIASQPTTDASTGATTYAVTLKPMSLSNVRQLVGQNVQVTIKTATSRTKTWIVPVSAITTTANGDSFITVMRKSGHQVNLNVTPGLVAGGQESVVPRGGHLSGGDDVVIGVKS